MTLEQILEAAIADLKLAITARNHEQQAVFVAEDELAVAQTNFDNAKLDLAGGIATVEEKKQAVLAALQALIDQMVGRGPSQPGPMTVHTKKQA